MAHSQKRGSILTPKTQDPALLLLFYTFRLIDHKPYATLSLSHCCISLTLCGRSLVPHSTPSPTNYIMYNILSVFCICLSCSRFRHCLPYFSSACPAFHVPHLTTWYTCNIHSLVLVEFSLSFHFHHPLSFS